MKEWILILPDDEAVGIMRPLVRCKDCKYSDERIGGLFCTYGVCVDCVVEEYFFCREGDRRSE